MSACRFAYGDGSDTPGAHRRAADSMCCAQPAAQEQGIARAWLPERDFIRKIMQKAWKPTLCITIDEKARSERRFLAKNRFLANFWAPPGSPGPSRDDPENSQNRSLFSFVVNCGRKRARTASGRPQEGPGGPPRRPQGTILRRFSDRFCTSKTNEKT